MAPDTYDATVTASSGTLKPDIGPTTSVRPGACLTPRGNAVLHFHFNYEVLLVLLVLSGPV
jgi:hypothetical protein